MALGVLLHINPLINMLIHHHAVHTQLQVKQHIHATMSKRKIEDIIEESLPQTSKDIYLKAWKDFMEYTQSDGQPSEDDYIQYFDYLHRPPKNMKASSLWSLYSKLNSVSQMKYRFKLQNYPQLKAVSKNTLLNSKTKMTKILLNNK